MLTSTFQPRNAMMYRVVHEKEPKNLAVVGINKKVLNEQGVFITDGNAAHETTQFYYPSRGSGSASTTVVNNSERLVE